MNLKIGKILKEIGFRNSGGLSNIPLIIVLLLMAIAIPVATNLVQRQQDIRNRAAYPTIPIGPGCSLCNDVECCSPNSCQKIGDSEVCAENVTGQCDCSATTCLGQTCNNGKCAGSKDCSEPQACGVNNAGFCSDSTNCDPKRYTDLQPISGGGSCSGGVCCKHNAPNNCSDYGGSCVNSLYCRGGASYTGKCNGGMDTICCTNVGECATGSKVCNPGSPAKVGTCTNSTWSWSDCSSDTCNGNVCGAPTANYCSEHGATECSGGRTRTCRDNVWSDWYLCESGQCEGNSCKGRVCTPGICECVGTGAVRCCKSDGTGWNSSDCGEGTTCSGGWCNGPSITPTPTTTTGGGGQTSPTPVLCDCRHNPAAKAMGDANCDGSIDIYDVSIWRSESKDQAGTTTNKATWRADFDCNGFVNDDDRDKIWLPNYINRLVPAK